ncbi:hypothetical protein [Cellulosimicrobium sp. Marseille-Q4280]|uniref:hypothetical protein n=1 Tax=Cellulosimicrobium sp. Marseille-Q4280 TaxID=2937992 RepID=UPI00203B1F67|nr:hypothetical protein [Cellulosimicrobium sp. Marseille-Q4280]
MSTQTRVPAGVTTGGQFAATTRPEAAVDLAGTPARVHDGEVDAAEMAARRQALVEDCLSADSQGIGYRFEVEDLAEGVAYAIDPDAAGEPRETLLAAARETITAAAAGGRAWACAGEPGPLQHWSDDADAIVDEALDAAWRVHRTR